MNVTSALHWKSEAAAAAAPEHVHLDAPVWGSAVCRAVFLASASKLLLDDTMPWRLAESEQDRPSLQR